MLQKLKCWIGRHVWGPFQWSTDTTRECSACGRRERLTLVHAGMDRLWLKI